MSYAFFAGQNEKSLEMRSARVTALSAKTQIIKIASRLNDCREFSGGVVVECEAPTLGGSITGHYDKIRRLWDPVPEVSWVILASSLSRGSIRDVPRNSTKWI